MVQEEGKTGATEFETMFEESLRTVKPGGVVKGRVVGITSTHVLIDVGYKSEGQTPIQEFTDHQGNLQVKVGDDVEVFFDSSESENGGIVLSRQRAENIKVWEDIAHPSEVVHVGDKIHVVVLKFDAEKERISLGMKQLTPDPWNTVASKYPAGSRVQGKVISIMDYGAFVELESGIEGLIHISEMSWSRKIAHPSKMLQVGQQVEVVVLNVDPGHRRISLGLKQVMANPWEAAREKYPVGSTIKGPVRNITDFGIFIGIEEGIDGLAHVSDLHWTKKIKHPSELYKKGDIVEARVLGINVENERFSLGVKQMTTDPWKIIAERYPVGSKIKGQVTSVPDFGVFVRIEEGVEGLVHVSQLSTERVDKPSSLYKVGDEIEAEVINLDPNERKIGLSVRALRKSEERQEMENYLKREKEGGRFSFEKLLNDELRLDRDESKTKE